MKTSLSHLPENKQNEIRRIAEIIREVANPEMIVLFGSYAKGTFVEHRYRAQDGTEYEYISDYDFLVVTKDEPEEPFRIESSIMDRVDRYRPPVNLEIHSIAYINDGLGWGQYFFTDIVKEGVTLFNSNSFQFSAPRQLTQKEEKEKAESYFDVWFSSAKRFLVIAEFAYKQAFEKNDKLYEAVFNLHQATESLYYTVLLVFTGYKPKLHNLWKLRSKTKQYSEELFIVFKAETDKKDEALFDLLKRAYIDARYNQKSYNITFDEMKALIERVNSMTPIVEMICRERIASLQ